MSQSLELNLKTTSDVPQAVDKAKQAVSGFSKQVDEVNKKTTQSAKQETAKAGSQIQDIQKKFGTSFKDIFLSVLGPMALFTGAMAFIGRLIEENRKKNEDANQAAVEGTNELMSAEDRYWARKKDRENKFKQDTEQAALQRTNVTQDFLESKDPRAAQIIKRESERLAPLAEMAGGVVTAYGLARDPKIQEEVQKIIAEEASKAGVKTPDNKSSNFKGPEGFSNVIGVGPNPVIEAMNAQLEEARKTNTLLEKIAGDPGATSWMNSTPSRAALLMGR